MLCVLWCCAKNADAITILCADNKYSLFIKIMKTLRKQCFKFYNFKKLKLVILAIEYYIHVEFNLFTCFDNKDSLLNKIMKILRRQCFTF